MLSTSDQLDDDGNEAEMISKIRPSIPKVISTTSSTSHSSEVSCLYTAFEDKVRRFVDLIDEFRRQGLSRDVDLPAVVVVGDKSSGKSSILEAISGVSLPCGTGIQTRCPLEIQLKMSRDQSKTWKSYLRYTDKDDKVQELLINNSSEVKDKVLQAQTEMTEDEVGISNKVITLFIESSKSPDLTLIDLPGIVGDPLEGQPSDISEKTRNIIQDFIQKPEVIILCVVPADAADLTSNEAINMAQSADPEGLRTLAVMTKPDGRDRATEEEIFDIIKNKRLRLKMGFRIVRCRSEQDVINKMDLKAALKKESDFFENHRIYRKIDHELCGSKQLAESLSDILVSHIKKCIPLLRNELRRHLESTREKIEELGEPPPKDTAGKRLYFINTAKMFCDQMSDILNNQTKIPKTVVPRIDLETTSKLVTMSFLWRKCFVDLKTKIEEITKENFNSGNFEAEKIQIKMLSYRGNALPGFVDFELFEDLVREHVQQYEEPAFECLEEIGSDLMTIMTYTSEQCLAHIPSIKENVRDICEKVYKTCKDDARRLLRLEMKKERLVFSQDTTYLEQLQKSKDPGAQINYQVYQGGKDVTQHNAGVMRDLLDVYLDIANRRISDNVPMLLRSTQYDEFITTLKETINEVASTEDLDSLILEDATLTAKRTALHGKLKRLDEAMKMLNRQF